MKTVSLNYFILFVLLVTGTLFAQKEISVPVTYNHVSELVRGIESNGTEYLSASDFAAQFSIPFYHNKEKNKIELQFNKYFMKYSVDNPFIVVTDKETKKAETFQQSNPVILLNEDLYFPVQSSHSLLASYSGYGVTIRNTTKMPQKKTSPQNLDPVQKDSAKVTIPVNEEPSRTEAPSNLNLVATYSIDQKVNGTLLKISAKNKITKVRHKKESGKIRLRIESTWLDTEKFTRTFEEGGIERIEARNEEDGAELDIILRTPNAKYEVLKEKNEKTILLTIHNNKFDEPEDTDPDKKKRWKFDVIVLDPGHGGVDVGAIGVNGVYEKNINLGIALQIGGFMKKNMPGVKVVYTRDDDSFVALHERGKIANRNNGKLFISIHCNSTPTKPSTAHGYEFYLLRPGKTDEAIRIAELENSAIKFEKDQSQYQELTDENFILVTMAHSANMQYSEKFTELMDASFKKNTSISSRGVKQAGFYVLIGASMPNVLIEAGFMSNTKDVEYLSTDAGQEAIARAIYQAMKAYKEFYEKDFGNR